MNQEEKFNKKRLRSSNVSVVVSISLMLYLSGLLLLFVLNTNRIIDNLRENIGITVVLKENTSDKELRYFVKELFLKPYSKDVIYTSKEEAAEEMAEDLGESFIDFIGFNPLPSSIELKVFSNYSNKDSLKIIDNDLMNYKFIDSISAQYDMIDNLNKTKTRMGTMLFGLNIVLLLIIIIVINNTIKLSIYSNRHQIKTMQMIGATGSFIRKPFLTKSFRQGVLGATISVIMISLTLYLILNYYQDLEVLVSWFQYLLVVVVIYFLGILISFFTSYFAVNKYLDVKTKILY